MSYTAPPILWDHELIIGDTYQPAELQLTDAEGVAISLVDATGEMQIRSEPLGALLAEGTVTITSAADGELTWSIAAATTAELEPRVARYSVRLTFGDGSIRTILEGRVTIRRAIVS